MKTSNFVLPALIASGLQEWVKADLYTWIDYAGNIIGRYTNADFDIALPKYVSFPQGFGGDYVDTPDTAAVSITGSIEITAKARLTDWSPTSTQSLVSKDGDNSPDKGYFFQVQGGGGTPGKLWFQYSTNGTFVVQALSSVVTSIPDDTDYWVKVTYNSATGDVKFYTSADGITFIQLGTTVPISSGAMFDNGIPLMIGATGNTGNGNPLIGRIYSAEIRNGIGGTIVANFDATIINGRSGKMSTGEVWTLHNDTLIVGDIYSSTGPLFVRELVTASVGLEVDQMRVTVFPDPAQTIGGVPWLQALRDGLLDGGRLNLDRFMSDSWANVAVGSVKWFGGRVADIEVGRSSAVVNVVSDTALLDVQLPRNLYQPSCRWTLFDTGCTLVKSNFAVTGAVASGSDKFTIKSGLSQADDYFTLGTVTFTSGANSGVSRMVRSFANTNGQFALGVPLPFTPAVSDTFTIYPGCDKLVKTCGQSVVKTFTADAGTNKLTIPAHGFIEGFAITLATTGALPAPLATGTIYFVRSPGTNDFLVSAALTGSTIDITNTGSGIHQTVIAGKFGNLPNFGGHPFIPAASPNAALARPAGFRISI